MHASHDADPLHAALRYRFDEPAVLGKILDVRRGSVVKTVPPCKVDERVRIAQLGARIFHTEYIALDPLGTFVHLRETEAGCDHLDPLVQQLRDDSLP